MDDYETENLENNEFNEDISEKQTRRSANLQHNLPGKSSYFDNQIRQIIVAYWLVGKHGEKELSYKDFSSNSLGFDNKRVSSNNNFLEEIGILRKGSKASVYKLTEKGILLSEALNYKKEDLAKELLRDIIHDTWVFESIYKLFGLKESVSKEDLIIELAHASKADLQMHRTRLTPLVDILTFCELVTIDSENEQVKFNNSFDGTYVQNEHSEDNLIKISQNEPTNESASNAIKNVDEKTSTEIIQKPITTNFKVENSSSPANINVDISISLEITPEMTPEEIKGKLDAIISSFKDSEQ